MTPKYRSKCQRGGGTAATNRTMRSSVPGAQLVSLSVEQDGPALTLRVRVRERDVAAAVAVSFER
jgi:hypothetical protein